MDDASYQHFGAYGCNWVNTPNFDRIADQGVLFTRAYTPNAKCAPSRSAIITGRNPWQLEEAANHWPFFPAKFKTYPEVFSENGYHVGYTGKGWAPGIAKDSTGNNRALVGKRYNKHRLEPPTKGISSIDYLKNFVQFLDSNKNDEPFLFWFGSFEPHRRYEYGSGLNKGAKNLSDIDSIYPFWPQNDTVRTDLLDYAFEIEYFDKVLGEMIRELKKRNALDNTIILVTSDNGMPFPRIKGQEYELSNHMPMSLMWNDGMKHRGRAVDDFISFIDLAPTFMELAGIKAEVSGMESITGESFTDILYSDKSGVVDKSRDHVLIGKERHDVGRPDDQGYPIRGIVKGDFLFIENFENSRWPAGNPETGYLNCDGSPTKTLCINSRHLNGSVNYWKWSFGKRPQTELYDIKNDIACINNLIGQDEYNELSTGLKEQLYHALEEQSDPRILGRGYIFDQYPYANKSGVNFYSRFKNGEKLNSGWVNPSDFDSLINESELN